MATFTALRAAPTFPVGGRAAAGVLQVAWGSYTLGAAIAQNDIIQFCRVPAGATVIGGFLQGADIDSGTEALDIDVGWAANGTELADPDGFGNNGVITGDAPPMGGVAQVYMPLSGVLITTGPQRFSAETIIQAVCNAAANAGGTGVLTLVVFYTMV